MCTNLSTVITFIETNNSKRSPYLLRRKQSKIK